MNEQQIPKVGDLVARSPNWWYPDNQDTYKGIRCRGKIIEVSKRKGPDEYSIKVEWIKQDGSTHYINWYFFTIDSSISDIVIILPTKTAIV